MAKEITVPEPVKITDAKGELVSMPGPDNTRLFIADPCACTGKKKGEATQLGEGKAECETCKGKGLLAPTMRFSDFCEQLADDPKFQKTVAGLRASTAIVHQSIERAPGDTFKLTDGEHKLVCEVVNEPSEGHTFVPAIARCAMRGGFYDAILKAKDS